MALLPRAGSWPKDKESKVEPLGPDLETSFLQWEDTCGARALHPPDTGEGRGHLSCAERLEELGLFSLEGRLGLGGPQ